MPVREFNEVFIDDGTWVRPDGVDVVFVTMCSGGQAGVQLGSIHPYLPGKAGPVIYDYPVPVAGDVAVVVGNGGSNQAQHGEATSFGPVVMGSTNYVDTPTFGVPGFQELVNGSIRGQMNGNGDVTLGRSGRQVNAQSLDRFGYGYGGNRGPNVAGYYGRGGHGVVYVRWFAEETA